MNCLKCNAERNLKDLQCPKCGVFYAKYQDFLDKKSADEKVKLEQKLNRLEELERKEQERTNNETNQNSKKKKKGCLFLLVKFFLALFVLILMTVVFYRYAKHNQTSLENLSPTISTSESNDMATKSAVIELKKMEWVTDLYISPGHLNVGVIAGEKKWDSPMIGRYVCGVLHDKGSALNFVRFVDIQEVVNQEKSPSEAEIIKFRCSDLI